MKVVFIVGMPGSGKTLAVSFLKKLGLDVVNMGDVVREEAISRGIEITPENLGKISVELREKYGKEEVARRCLPKIIKYDRDIVIEGIRSFYEINYFKKNLNADFIILAIHASPKTRFERLLRRGREDDPKNLEEFKERDLRELKYGLGDVIALADYMIVNEYSIEYLKKEVEKFYKKFFE